jgi:hypothetical protein
MHSTRVATALAIPSVLLLALTACFPTGGTSSTACISDKTWVLDLDDSANQLGELLASHGLNVTESTGEGRQTFRFDHTGHATASLDITYTITVVTNDLTMTIVQTHSGEPSGGWAWDGDSNTITFVDWDNADYAIQNTMVVNGVASDAPIVIPSEDLGSTAMETECSGSTLTTHVVGAPFTQHWAPA